MPTITERHLRYLKLLAEGLTDEQIAKVEKTTVRAARSHLNILYRSIGIEPKSGNCRMIAVNKARQEGWI